MSATLNSMLALILMMLSSNILAHIDAIFRPTEHSLVFGSDYKVTCLIHEDSLKRLTLHFNGGEVVFPEALTDHVKVPHWDTVIVRWSRKMKRKTEEEWQEYRKYLMKKLARLEPEEREKRLKALREPMPEYHILQFKFGKEADKKFGKYPEAKFMYLDDGTIKLMINEYLDKNRSRWIEIKAAEIDAKTKADESK